MRQINLLIIVAKCTIYAANNELKIVTLNKDNFIAQGVETSLNVPITHLYEQLEQGHSIEDTLNNETNLKTA